MWDAILHILSVIGSALFMIIFFGLCIFVHELGHFLVARMCGLRVLAFSIGFRKIWAKKIKGVEYRIGWIPVGGYVDLPQIDATGEPKDENGDPLPRAKPWKRIVTAAAGPLFNILFAMLLGCAIWVFGLPQSTPKMTEFKVKTVQVDKPEYNAGLRPGDVIIKLNGRTFNSTWNSFSQNIMLTVGDVTLTVRKPDGTIKDIVYQPVVNRQVAPSAKIPIPFFTVELPVVIAPLKDSPAEKAGLKKGDRITKLNGIEVGRTEFLTMVHFANKQPLVAEYIRKENNKEITGTVTVYPAEIEGDDFVLGIAFDPETDLLVESVYPNMPAAEKLKAGDRITAVNGKKAELNQDVIRCVLESRGEPVELTILRGEQEQTFSISAVRKNKLGVKFQYLTYPTPVEQLVSVLNTTWRSLKSVAAGIGRKLGMKDAGYTTLGPQHFSGPIGIGETLYMSVYRGSLIIGLNLVVVISFSLGLFNLLPIPVLDGGHILLAVLEIITRRPPSEKILHPITGFFVLVLIGFMLFVTFFDIKRLLPAEAEKQGKIIREADMVKENGK